MTMQRRPQLTAWLLTATEILLLLTMAAAALLYSPRLADNALGKAALVHMIGGVCALCWTLGRLANGHIYWSRTGQWLPFLGLLAVSAVSGFGAHNGHVAFDSWLLWTQWLVLLIVTVDLARDADRATRIVTLLLGLSIVISSIGLLQVAGLDLMSLPHEHAASPLSSLGNTNFVAHYLEQVLPLALAVVVFRAWSGALRCLAALSLASGGMLIVLAGSRGGWFGVGAAMVVMLAAVPRRRGWAQKLLLVLLVVGLLSPVAGFVLQSIPVSGGRTAATATTQIIEASWARVMSTFDASNFSRAMRLLIWRDTARVVRAQPWLGVGPGHLGFELAAHRTTTGQREWRKLMGKRVNEPRHAHSEFLEVWAESGVAAAVALTWLLAAGLWLAWRMARRPPDDGEQGRRDRSIAFGCLGALVAAVVHAFFSFNLRDPVSGTHVWILCGILAGRANATESRERNWSLAPLWRRVVLLSSGAGIALVGLYTGLCMLKGDAYFLSSQQHLSAGHGNRAILALQQATDWREHEYSYHHWLGHISLQMKLYDQAAAALSRSLELHDNNPGAARLLATALLATGDGQQALAPLRHAVDIDPLEADNYSLLADALRQAQQPAAAATARRQALSLRGDPNLMAALGSDLYAAGHLDSATAVLLQAAHTWPQVATIAGNLGAMLLQAGDVDTALDYLHRAIALEPTRAEWHGNLALALRSLGRHAEALASVRTALELAPGNSTWQQLSDHLADHLATNLERGS